MTSLLKPRPCDVGSVHVAFYVVNIDALLTRLGTKGWKALSNVQPVRAAEQAFALSTCADRTA